MRSALVLSCCCSVTLLAQAAGTAFTRPPPACAPLAVSQTRVFLGPRAADPTVRARGDRGRPPGRLQVAADANFMRDASHPGLARFEAGEFDASPPALRLGSVKSTHDDMREVHLLWSTTGECFEEGEATQDDEVKVGKLEFSDVRVPGKLERVLGARVAHLKNVMVLPQLRGRGCGEQLLGGMAVALAAVRGADGSAEDAPVAFVALRHLDKGSGKLIEWYKNAGFVPGREIDQTLGKRGLLNGERGGVCQGERVGKDEAGLRHGADN